MKSQSEHKGPMNGKLSQRPFFSIIITTYNRAEVINRALDSLIKQTEEDWEGIVVDDGGLDDTYNKVFPYLVSGSKIRYIQKAHTGEAASKNDGVYSSCGRYISFLDSDDEYKPKHLEYRKAILLEFPEVKFLYGGVKILGNPYVPDRINLGKIIKLENCVIGGTFFIERSLFISFGGFRNIYLGTDSDFFQRIKSSGVNMKETRRKTYIYHHEMQDSITNQLYSQIQTTRSIHDQAQA